MVTATAVCVHLAAWRRRCSATSFHVHSYVDFSCAYTQRVWRIRSGTPAASSSTHFPTTSFPTPAGMSWPSGWWRRSAAPSSFECSAAAAATSSKWNSYVFAQVFLGRGSGQSPPLHSSPRHFRWIPLLFNILNCYLVQFIVGVNRSELKIRLQVKIGLEVFTFKEY